MRYLFALTALSLHAGLAGAGDQKWGTIKGQVVFDAAARPALKKIDVTKDRKHCLSKGPLFDESWTVNKKNLGVRWAFVWLKPEPDGNGKLPVHPGLAKANGKGPVLDQPCCQFVPHCLAMRDGEELLIKNSANVAHNSNVGGLVNPLIAAGGEYRVKAGVLIAKKLPYQISCSIHPWMKAWVMVADHPYVAVTDKDGKFEMKKAPAGNYRLVVWQEEVGYLGGAKGRDGKKVAIKPDGVTDLGKLKIKPD
jgi:hypothetical protein